MHGEVILSRSTFAWAFLAAALLTACGDEPTRVSPRSKVYAAPDGYGAYKLGQTFDEALVEIDVSRFYPDGLRGCLTDLPLNGCGLSEEPDSIPAIREAGMPYHLGLSFNRLGKLTDVGLTFKREGSISAEQCLDIHGRSLDWLAAKYGPLASQHAPEEEAHVVRRKSAGGHVFTITRPSKDGFLAPFMRSVGRSTAKQRSLPITKWNGDRYVSLFTHYMILDGRGICDVDIEFSEPAAVERPKYVDETPAPSATPAADDAEIGRESWEGE